MAGIKHIPFLVTIAVLLIDRTHGGYYTDPNKVLSLPSEINNLPNNYIANSDANKQEIQENALNHNDAHEPQEEEENTKTQYVIEQNAEPVQPDHFNAQQGESITQPIENQFYKTEHFYLNPVLTVDNNVQNVEPMPSFLYAGGQQLLNQHIQPYPYAYQNQLNYNIPAYNILVPQQNQQVILQRDPLQIANLQAVVPTSYATSLNVVQDTQENIVQILPLNTIQSQDENQISIENNAQNDLTSILNIPVTEQQSNEQSDLTSFRTQDSQPENVEQKPVEPIVTKDVYFHVPPPEIEEKPAPVSPSKKTYKIIFIKLPSQERKNSALQNIYNNYAATEDKTLIYVLVKNQEQQQVIVPQSSPSKPSEHEVIFVKYKTNKASSGTTYSEEEREQRVDDSLLLKPGLVNGQWK